jgi:hypothetical protein
MAPADAHEEAGAAKSHEVHSNTRRALALVLLLLVKLALLQQLSERTRHRSRVFVAPQRRLRTQPDILSFRGDGPAIVKARRDDDGAFMPDMYIYTPSNRSADGAPIPVCLFIHGGGFVRCGATHNHCRALCCLMGVSSIDILQVEVRSTLSAHCLRRGSAGRLPPSTWPPLSDSLPAVSRSIIASFAGRHRRRRRRRCRHRRRRHCRRTPVLVRPSTAALYQS